MTEPNGGPRRTPSATVTGIGRCAPSPSTGTSEPLLWFPRAAQFAGAEMIILCDPDPIARARIAGCIRALDIPVAETHAATDALALTMELLDVQLVLAQVGTPGSQGFGLCRWARRIRRGIAVAVYLPDEPLPKIASRVWRALDPTLQSCL